MSSYVGKHAYYYDLFYRDKPYQDEAKTIDRLIKKYAPSKSKDILELACGTGGHAFELEKLGYSVAASDYSESMIKVAKEKANSSKSKIDFRVMDMRSLPDIDTRPDIILCLFDSIGYTLTNRAILSTLDGVKRNLKQGGLFIFEFWHAGAMIRNFDPLRVRKFKTADSEILRISETDLDIQNQVATVSYTIKEFQKNGRYTELNETQQNRFFLIQEMNLFLTSAGLTPIKFFNGYTGDEAIDSDSWHILSLAKNYL